MAKSKKRSRKHSSSLKGVSKAGVKNLLVNAACVVGGMAVGKVVNDFVADKNGGVAGLLGLEGNTASYVGPVATAGAGIALASFVKDPMVKMAAVGMTAVGVGKAVNTVANKTLVPLLGIEEDETPRLQLPASLNPEFEEMPPVGDIDYEVEFVEGTNGIPGVGAIPGVGTTEVLV